MKKLALIYLLSVSISGAFAETILYSTPFIYQNTFYTKPDKKPYTHYSHNNFYHQHNRLKQGNKKTIRQHLHNYFNGQVTGFTPQLDIIQISKPQTKTTAKRIYDNFFDD